LSATFLRKQVAFVTSQKGDRLQVAAHRKFWYAS